MTSHTSASEPKSSGAASPAIDVALIIAGTLALVGWTIGYFPVIFGFWWGLIWLGPVLYAARRLWSSSIRHGSFLAAIPLVAFVLLGEFEVEFGYTSAWPWWLSHAAMATVLLVVALCLRSRSPTKRFSPRLALLALAALACPWIGLGTLGSFWGECVQLQIGMSVDDVVAVFRDCYVQNPGTQDGCDRSPVDGMRLENWRTSDTIIFCPFDGSEEACTADGCWTWFEDGRLIRYWASPD